MHAFWNAPARRGTRCILFQMLWRSMRKEHACIFMSGARGGACVSIDALTAHEGAGCTQFYVLQRTWQERRARGAGCIQFCVLRCAREAGCTYLYLLWPVYHMDKIYTFACAPVPPGWWIFFCLLLLHVTRVTRIIHFYVLRRAPGAVRALACPQQDV